MKYIISFNLIPTRSEPILPIKVPVAISTMLNSDADLDGAWRRWRYDKETEQILTSGFQRQQAIDSMLLYL